MSLFNGNALLAAILAAVVAFVGYGKAQRWAGSVEGEKTAVLKMEAKDAASADKIRTADKRAREPASGGVRRVRDPHAVSE
jgi:hypothetical protein